ncbi:ligase-associated DNA damage response exonuclease [Brevundimonas sp.]|uniref:ligase-associated DNA damage response exonuclease n=1 Tax=Brevundimonas sp. TaxID=1871086 RepID=UPI002FCCB280
MTQPSTGSDRSHFSRILRPTKNGLWCPQGDFYIDPPRPVDRAIITHGHADHARWGHGHVLATRETLAIMAVRYGSDFAQSSQSLSYGENVNVNGVKVSLHPAGHVLGSAQVTIRLNGFTITASGDYKRRRDPTCVGFEPVPSDVFITEATFGLPVFRHPPDSHEIGKLIHSLQQFPERAHLVGAYALGKAQRVMKLLREAGYDETIYVHGALEKLNRLYESFGVDLGSWQTVSDVKADFAGKIVIAPPSAIADRWSRRCPDPVGAFASGWMSVRARARQRGVELPIILSDHADWDELTDTLTELNPTEVWITHGRDDALSRWAEINGMKARALHLVGYEEEDDEPVEEAVE